MGEQAIKCSAIQSKALHRVNVAISEHDRDPVQDTQQVTANLPRRGKCKFVRLSGQCNTFLSAICQNLYLYGTKFMVLPDRAIPFLFLRCPSACLQQTYYLRNPHRNCHQSFLDNEASESAAYSSVKQCATFSVLPMFFFLFAEVNNIEQ